MIKYFISIALVFILSKNALAITPTFNVIKEINFGLVLPEQGSCRMYANTGVIIGYIGQLVCILPGDATNGRYTIIANPNKTIQIKVLPNQDNGDGVIFNPYIKLVSAGEPDELIYNSTSFKEINSGADGIVDLYLGGDLIISRTYAYGQTIEFNFLDAIEWYEVP